MEVGELVQEVKTAIRAYQWEFDDLLFSQIDLELATTLEVGVGGSYKFNVAEVKADLSKKHAQTVSVSLVPPRPSATKGFGHPEYAGELFDAFKAIRAAVLESGKGDPPFTLKEGKVTLNFSVKASGSLKVFFGPSGGDEVSQTIAVTVGLPAA